MNSESRNPESGLERLGDGAAEILADLDGSAEHELAREGLLALADALGEDDPLGPTDPGLPEDFVLGRLLGRGSGGVVYAAYQRSLEREVAVKLLHPGGLEADMQRLLGEARRLASLRHPAIACVHEVGRAREGVFMVLDLYEGGSLQQLLGQGAQNPMRAARLVRQVAEGIAMTHAAGVVHLDLKPGNVLLDGQGNAAVADFGLAREVRAGEVPISAATSGAGLLGTPAYMAPEQAANQRSLIGERTDVYGLGALLYACLTGGPPCERQSLADTLQAVRFEEPLALDLAAPKTPKDLAAIAYRALAKNPERRYPSAAAMAQDLARFEQGEPVEARLPSEWGRVWRRLRSHSREILVASAAAAVAVLTVLPGRRDSRGSAEAWLQAAQELASIEGGSVVGSFLETLPPELELSDGQERRIETLRQRARLATLAGEEGERDATARNLGIRQAQWDWLQGLMAEDRAEWPGLRTGTPLEVESTWRDFARELAERFAGMEAPDRERSLELLDRAPQWESSAGFQGWIEPPPADPAQLVSRLAEGSLVELGPAEIWLDVFVVDPKGRSQRLASQRGQASPGERLCLEGRGRTDLLVPRDIAGMDFLRNAPVGSRVPRPGDLWFQLEGSLVPSTAGAFWDIRDRESVLRMKRQDGSWFLKFASSGVLVGGASLVEAHSYRWEGHAGVTVLMLVDSWPAGEEPPVGRDRTLADWRQRLEACLEEDLARLDAYGVDRPVPAAARAAATDRVISLACLGGSDLAGPLERARSLRQKADLGWLSEGFFPEGTHTTVTGSGGDLEFWSKLALEGQAAEPLAVLDWLPLPRSAYNGRKVGLGWQGWLNMFYLVQALLFFLAWLKRPPRSPQRLAALAGAGPLALMCIDRTSLPQLGSLPLDALGCALMACACYGMRPWAGRAAGLGALLFGLAAIHEISTLFVPQPRVPLALAFALLPALAAGLDPVGRLRPWWPLLSAALLVAAGLLWFGGLGLPWATPVYFLQFALCLGIGLLVAVTGIQRSKAETGG